MMRGSGGPVLVVLFNIIALSALFIGNIVWKSDRGYINAYNELMSNLEAPSLGAPYYDDDDGVGVSNVATDDGDNSLTPSYLQWDVSPVEEPKDWTWNKTSSIFCKNNNTNAI